MKKPRDAPETKAPAVVNLSPAVVQDTFTVLPPPQHSSDEPPQGILGLANCRTLLDQVLTRPVKRADLYQGYVEPTRFMALYGPPGSGKRILITAHAHSLGLSVIVFAPEDMCEDVFDRLLDRAAEAPRGCVVVFDHCDGYFLRGQQDMRTPTQWFRRALKKWRTRHPDASVWFVWATGRRPQDLLEEVCVENTAYAEHLSEGELRDLWYQILQNRGDWLQEQKIAMTEKQLHTLLQASQFCIAADLHRYCTRVFTRAYNRVPVEEFRRHRHHPIDLAPVWEDFQQCLYRNVDGGWRICTHDPAAVQRALEPERVSGAVGGLAAAIHPLDRSGLPVQEQ